MKFLAPIGYFCGCATLLAQTAVTESDFFLLNAGPWGELEAQNIQVSPSADWVRKNEKLTAETVWHFDAPSMEELRRLFVAAGLSPEATQQLLSDERCSWDGTIFTVRPPSDVIESLAIKQRTLLYTYIRATRPNSYFGAPATIENGDPLAWFSSFGIPTKTAQHAARFCFPLGRSLAFSDHLHIARQIPDVDDRVRFYQAAHQTSAAVLRLRLTPDSDIDALARYWSSPQSFSETRAKLQSVQPRSGERWLDVAHLLPPMPRSRLYTFRSESDFNRTLPDCRWTSLNFFADLPSERHADFSDDFDQVLATFYNPALPPYRFGDVIAIRDQESGRLVHACVYIADDVVFTKNGSGDTRPWILQRDRHLSRIYATDRPVRMEGFRRKRLGS